MQSQRPEGEQESPSPTSPGRRRRGRPRGVGAAGDQLVARLGPASPDAAAYHNPLTLAPFLPDGEVGPPSPDTDLAELSFVSLDCETTGHFPHRMVELGAVRFQLGADDQPPAPRISLESLVHTADHINPYARRVHGINSSMLGGAPTLRQVAAAFADLASGAVLVEHSADGFDTRLVGKALGRPLRNPHLDTSRLAGFLFQLRDTIGLERLCERLGVTHRSPHFALADAEATADCFVHLIRLGQEEFGWRRLGDLVEVGMPPPPRPGPRTSQRHPRPGAEPVEAVRAAAPEATPANGNGRRRHRGGRGRRPTRPPQVHAGVPSPEEA